MLLERTHEAGADDARELRDVGRRPRSTLQPRQTSTEWIARDRVAAAEIQLARGPTIPRVPQPGQQPAVGSDDWGPLLGASGVAAAVGMHPRQVDLRHLEGAPAQPDPRPRAAARFVQ